MELDLVSISNHSRIADARIAIRGHAVIVGANDVGKTSLLRMLNLLLGATTGQLYQQVSVSDLADAGQDLVVEARFVKFSDHERALFVREISIDAETKSESMRVQLILAADPTDEQAVTVRRWFPEAGHDRTPTRDQLAAFGWRYLPATRGSSTSSLDGPNSALQALLRAIDLGAEKEQLAGLLSQFNSQLGSSARIKELRTDVALHLSKAMPRDIDQDDLVVRTASDPEAGVLGNVSMFFKREDDYASITDQSDGLRQLMSMTLFDLAEGAANVVAIDEPELHLHPASQRTVAELFGAGRNQKILATHSPYIVHRFEPSQIIAVSPDGVCHQISADKLTAVEKLRANWWSPRLLEVLAARIALLVEGVSDRVIVEAVARLMSISLDKLGAVVFDLDGAMKFPHVYKLIGKSGFCVPMLGLVDDAEKGKWLGQVGGKPRNVFGTTIFVSNPDLEAEYCAALTGPGTARALIAAGLCDESAILQTSQASMLDDVTDTAMAHYCRNHKVEAAVAIASQLKLEAAAKITSVHSLLMQLQSVTAV